jgi:hypothetical protein
MRKRLIRVGLALAMLMLFAAWLVYVMCAAWYWQTAVGAPLERDLGFWHGTPYIRETGASEARVVLTVESIVPGSVFDQAGFKSGDIVRGLSINGLFQELHRGRGRQVTIRVVDGGDGPPLEQRSERAITFLVPPAP